MKFELMSNFGALPYCTNVKIKEVELNSSKHQWLLCLTSLDVKVMKKYKNVLIELFPLDNQSESIGKMLFKSPDLEDFIIIYQFMRILVLFQNKSSRIIGGF